MAVGHRLHRRLSNLVLAGWAPGRRSRSEDFTRRLHVISYVLRPRGLSTRQSQPAVGRAIFAWSRLEGVDLDLGLAQVSAVILPFIREGRLAA